MTPTPAAALLAVLLTAFLAACEPAGDVATPGASTSVAPTPEILLATAEALANPEPVASAPVVFPACGASLPKEADLERLLGAAAHTELAAVLTGIHAAARSDPACDVGLWDAREFFSHLDASHHASLDRWVEAQPGEAWAWAARGLAHMGAGYHARGGAVAKETPAAQFDRMRAEFNLAKPDLMRAVELDPLHIAAYGGMIDILKSVGTADTLAALLSGVLELEPRSYHIRSRAMHAFGPYWKGSLAVMQAIADDALAHVAENPRLARLQGYPIFERARAASREKDFVLAEALSREALSHGEHPDWRRRLVLSIWHQKDWPRVIQACSDGLESDPSSRWLLDHRGRAHGKQKSYELGLADLERAVATEPESTASMGALAFMREQAGRPEEAVEDYRRLVERRPDYAWAVVSLGNLLRILGRHDEALPHLEHGAAISEKARTQWKLARLYESLGRDEDARNVYDHYLAQVDRGSPDERRRLAHAQKFLGDEASVGAGRVARTLPGLSLIDVQPGV